MKEEEEKKSSLEKAFFYFQYLQYDPLGANDKKKERCYDEKGWRIYEILRGIVLEQGRDIIEALVHQKLHCRRQSRDDIE